MENDKVKLKITTNNFQREGSRSNAHVGREFENAVKVALEKHFKIDLKSKVKIDVGIKGRELKPHTFDLGNENNKIIVECKSQTWTKTGNNPSAKFTICNEAMFYFHLAPPNYRKIFVVKMDRHDKHKLSLAETYIQRYKHFIPFDVEIYELDTENGKLFFKNTK